MGDFIFHDKSWDHSIQPRISIPVPHQIEYLVCIRTCDAIVYWPIVPLGQKKII